MYRFYRITVDEQGTEHPSLDEYEDVNVAEGNFEFQKGLAMENHSFAFLMLLDNTGAIHKDYIATVGEGIITPRLFEVKTTTEETAKSYLHETAYDVSADFYKRIGGAKQDVNVRAEMLRGVDENGNLLEYEYWVRPIEIPEPTPEV